MWDFARCTLLKGPWSVSSSAWRRTRYLLCNACSIIESSCRFNRMLKTEDMLILLIGEKWTKRHSIGGFSGLWGSQCPLFLLVRLGPARLRASIRPLQKLVLCSARGKSNREDSELQLWSFFEFRSAGWSASMWSGSFGEASGADEGPIRFICKSKLIWWTFFSRFNELLPLPTCMSEAKDDHGDPPPVDCIAHLSWYSCSVTCEKSHLWHTFCSGWSSWRWRARRRP